MSKFLITCDAAERIVEAGTEKRLDLRQNINRLKYNKKTINYGVVAGTVVVPNKENGLIVTVEVFDKYNLKGFGFNEGQVSAIAPLLKNGEILQKDTVVIIAKDIKSDWVVISAQCPEDD